MRFQHITLPIGVLAVVGSAFAAGAPSAHAAPTASGTCAANVCFVLTGNAKDSDGDGFTDADEIAFGSDPFDPASRPSVPWMLESLANGFLPSVFLDPQIDLAIVTPDGHALTTDVTGALGMFGLKPRDPMAAAGMTLAPPGIDLGTLGRGTPALPMAPPSPEGPSPFRDGPNRDEYGLVPPGEVHMEGGSGAGKGDLYVQNTMPTPGKFHSEVQIYQGDKLIGRGSATSSDPWAAQSEAVKAAGADAGATPEQSANVADQVNAQAQATAEAISKEQARLAAEQKAVAEAKKREEQERKKKEEEEKKKKEEEEKKKDGGTYVDPDAGSGVTTPSVTDVEHVVATHGTQNTNKRPTPVVVDVSSVPDAWAPLILTDPDAGTAPDPNAVNGPPNTGNKAGPETRNDLPVIPVGGPLPSNGY